MTIACVGIGVNAGLGVAIGPVHRVRHGTDPLETPSRHGGDLEAELQRYREAVDQAGAELRSIREQIPASTSSDISEFIDTHLLMLEDRALTEGPLELIRSEGLSAEWALQHRRDELMRVFDEMDDPYLRTRKDDIQHVTRRILKALLQQTDEEPADLSGHIVLADEITPADAILMKQRGIAGFITEFGGPMSHTAILARSLGIPAIVGARGAGSCLRHHETVVLDARHGVVLADCDAAALAHFQGLQDAQRRHALALQQLISEPARSRDQVEFSLLGNIELPEDVAAVRANGADGIGLYRTEFLYMNRATAPDEEEHFEAYRAVVEGMDGLPVTIRTLDLGADKQVDGTAGIGANNPALGLRAIRLCLKEPDLFRPQLRAILRASALGPVRLMIPMLTNVWEAIQARAMIEDCMRDLEREGIAFDPALPVGGMIEVPAAALSAHSFAEELDFLSLGTNDLIQYTLAIDRVDDEVNYLYDPLHPAVLQLIKTVIDAGQAHRIPVSMCGEMAGDPLYVPLLAGLGLRRFSMQAGQLLDAKRILRELDIATLTPRCEQLLKQLPQGTDPRQLQHLLH